VRSRVCIAAGQRLTFTNAPARHGAVQQAVQAGEVLAVVVGYQASSLSKLRA
jgi:hypothetical protein